jgi:hypothetical protein
MALSPADFYSYSRATGAPIPEDPEERARMAPEVLEYRRNQLKAPRQEQQQGPDPLSVGLGIGIALAGGGLGAYGLNKLLRGPKRSANAGVRQADLGSFFDKTTELKSERQEKDFSDWQARQSSEPQPSKQPIAVTEEPVRQVPDVAPEQEITVPGSPQPMIRRHGRMVPREQGARRPSFTPRSYIEDTGAVAPVEDLTTKQQQELPEVIDQKINAVESGEDQTTGRFLRSQQIDTDFVKFSRQAAEISAEAAAQKAAAFALATQKSKAPKNARALQALGPNQGLSQEEIFHRISASASDYRPGSMEPLTQLDIAALLDPTVPTENVKDLLGTTLAVRGGRVGRNLDYEVMAEGGGMTQRGKDVDIVGEFGSDVLAYNPRTGQFEIDTSTDLEDLNLTAGRTSDYETNAADYGDVEGPGGFVSTRGFKERTKSGTTIVPGQITEATGAASGSLRQEREIDRVLPARETLEGDPAAGWTFDPQTGKAIFVGAGTRSPETRVNVAGKPIRVVEAKTGRAPLGAYQGQITVDDPSYDPSSGGKFTGRFQPATGAVSVEITTQPVTEYMTAQERLIQDEKGNWYVNQAKTKVVGDAPLKGYVGSDPYPKNLSLNRDELNNVLTNASELWSAQGGGTGLERQTFLIESLDDYLKTSRQTTLSVLQPNTKGYLSSAAFDFINNIQPGMKETNIFVKPAKVNQEGRPLVNRETFKSEKVKETPLVDPDYAEMDPVPLVGKTKVSGAGGVSAQELETEINDEYATFFSPRIETAPQRVTPGAGKPPSGESGSVLSRPYLDTPPVGFSVRSPGSFARTQNPYTGAAAAAMGPASRATTGNYQYTPGQLRVLLEPTSQSKLQQRNQFALAANLTPGGTVRQGALQLGGGLGAIPAGIESLPSESATIERYGVTGGQLKQVGETLMSRAAQRKATSQTPMQAQPLNQEAVLRDQASARHLANYITAAAQRLEGPETWQGDVKLKGKGQSALRPYQAPSEAMLKQLMRAYQ